MCYTQTFKNTLFNIVNKSSINTFQYINQQRGNKVTIVSSIKGGGVHKSRAGGCHEGEKCPKNRHTLTILTHAEFKSRLAARPDRDVNIVTGTRRSGRRCVTPLLKFGRVAVLDAICAGSR
jgi:hypothetical protein